MQPFGLRMPIDGVVEMPLQASIFTPGRMICIFLSPNYIMISTKLNSAKGASHAKADLL